jgi:holin-like protein
MIEGFFIIFFYLVLGTLVSDFTGNLIPGNVIGMMLLFVSLLCRIIKPHQVKPAADALTKNMALFFVPVGVGLMTTISAIEQSWAAIVVASVVSTVIVIVVTAIIQQKMERWKK